MDYYQSIVAEWLTADGRTLVAQEYGLRTSHVQEFKVKGQKNLWPDILAVRPRDKRAFLCEVSWSKDWKRTGEKLAKYHELMPQIRESLDHWLAIPTSNDWVVHVWYFVPEAQVEKTKQLGPAGLGLRVSSLDQIKPWTYTHGWRVPDDLCGET